MPEPTSARLDAVSPGSTARPPTEGPAVGLERLLGPSPEPAAILEALRQVIDPELGVNIVDLGLVYGVSVEDGRARVRLTTTSPACPIGAYLVDGIGWALLSLDGIVDVEVEVTHDPPWSPERMSDVARAILGWER